MPETGFYRYTDPHPALAIRSPGEIQRQSREYLTLACALVTLDGQFRDIRRARRADGACVSQLTGRGGHSRAVRDLRGLERTSPGIRRAGAYLLHRPYPKHRQPLAGT